MLDAIRSGTGVTFALSSSLGDEGEESSDPLFTPICGVCVAQIKHKSWPDICLLTMDSLPNI